MCALLQAQLIKPPSAGPNASSDGQTQATTGCCLSVATHKAPRAAVNIKRTEQVARVDKGGDAAGTFKTATGWQTWLNSSRTGRTGTFQRCVVSKACAFHHLSNWPSLSTNPHIHDRVEECCATDTQAIQLTHMPPMPVSHSNADTLVLNV